MMSFMIEILKRCVESGSLCRPGTQRDAVDREALYSIAGADAARYLQQSHTLQVTYRFSHANVPSRRRRDRPRRQVPVSRPHVAPFWLSAHRTVLPDSRPSATGPVQRSARKPRAHEPLGLRPSDPRFLSAKRVLRSDPGVPRPLRNHRLSPAPDPAQGLPGSRATRPIRGTPGPKAAQRDIADGPTTDGPR
jgi:hypothetical protein